MGSKQIPAVGEAFLGSDPQALKVTRVTFGDAGWSGGNDVDLTTIADTNAVGSVLISFGDSGIIITNIAQSIPVIVFLARVGIILTII